MMIRRVNKIPIVKLDLKSIFFFFFLLILCNYRDAYIIVKIIITKTEEGGDHAANPWGKRNKGIIFKNRVLFTDCSRKISSTEIVNAIDLDIVLLIYTLIQYSDSYSTTSESLWQHYWDRLNDV